MLPKRISKLLVANLADKQYLAYLLGKHNIYLERIKPIHTTANQHVIPQIAVIRYHKDSDITSFLKEPDIKAVRIFKSAVFRTKLKTKRLFYVAANNLLSLTTGLTLRIISKDPKLRKEFYEICLKANKEKNFGVKFDYDKYDIKVEIRSYKEAKRTWLIITTKGLSKFLEIKASTS